MANIAISPKMRSRTTPFLRISFWRFMSETPELDYAPFSKSAASNIKMQPIKRHIYTHKSQDADAR